ncbi:2-dehydro-3-deoxyglucarate aldolase [Rhizobium panacihumi]|uniref:2-dehydro-3-deoxyglucarate aldolase n=1 Tax=Rhizobium panacihumi TaxID=2008450 RepID=UPI003D7ABF2E
MPKQSPYTAVPNTIRQRLLARETLIGCWSALGSPITTEVLGLAGFDWLLIDLEHAPNDILSLIPQLMALKTSASAPFVRPQWNDTVLIKRLLDSGVYNFIIPYVQSVDEAQAAVAATRYPPHGVRGVSVSHRSNHYGTIADYMKVINDNITVVVQIENKAGVEDAAAMAAIDGVDALFVGPSDLAAAYGHLGNANHPEVQDAIKAVFAAAKAQGKASGILAPVEADARRYLDMGATFVGVGSDLGVFRGATQALKDKYLEPASAP